MKNSTTHHQFSFNPFTEKTPQRATDYISGTRETSRENQKETGDPFKSPPYGTRIETDPGAPERETPVINSSYRNENDDIREHGSALWSTAVNGHVRSGLMRTYLRRRARDGDGPGKWEFITEARRTITYRPLY